MMKHNEKLQMSRVMHEEPTYWMFLLWQEVTQKHKLSLFIIHTCSIYFTRNNAGWLTHSCWLSVSLTEETEEEREEEETLPPALQLYRKQLTVGLNNLNCPWAGSSKESNISEGKGWMARIQSVCDWIKVEMSHWWTEDGLWCVWIQRSLWWVKCVLCCKRHIVWLSETMSTAKCNCQRIY